MAIFSDRRKTYFLYDKNNFPAVAFGNFFPRFFANGKWLVVNSFCEFADNAFRVPRKRFVERLKQLGGDPENLPEFETKRKES